MKRRSKKIVNSQAATRVVTLWLEPKFINRVKTKAKKLNISYQNLIQQCSAEGAKK